MAAGTRLRYELDSARFQPEMLVSAPRQEPTSIRAALPAAAAPGNRTLVVEYPPVDDKARVEETSRAGFYRLTLRYLTGGKTEDVLFAANMDGGEGDLKRVEWPEIKTRLGDKVQYMKGKASLSSGALGTGTELWRTVLLILVGVLCVEQMLAWSFGRKR